MRRTIKMNIKRAISIALCMSMVTMFTVHKPIGAEEITTEEITTEETSENTGNLTGNFAEDVDYLVEKGTPYDMNEVYEVYGNAPKEINSANDWIANEAESEKISQFQEILEELAKQNHTDETTGVFVSGDTPWYIKVEVEEIDAGPLQESYEAYRERQQEMDEEDDEDEEIDEEDVENSDDGEEFDSSEVDSEDDEEDWDGEEFDSSEVDSGDDEEDWDEEEEERTPLQKDAARYMAFQYGKILGEQEYDNDRIAESKVEKAYQVRFYNAVTGEEYQCDEEQYIRIFFPYQRAYLGYETEVFKENGDDFDFYPTYLFDEEENGTYENSEEDEDAIDEDEDENGDDVDEDDQDEPDEDYDNQDEPDEDYDEAEDERSAKEINDAIDCSRYDLVSEIKGSGTYGILISERAINDSEGMAVAKNAEGTVQTGDETGYYFVFFFGASMFASLFLLTGRRKKYV